MEITRVGWLSLVVFAIGCGGPPVGTTPSSGGASDGQTEARDDVPWVPRDTFGLTSMPLWYPTGPFEQRAYGELDRARQGDFGALFDLALLGSGHLLSEAQVADFRRRLDDFVARVRPEVERENDPWQRGFVLHKAMQRDLLDNDQADATLSNYVWAQSALSPIFETGRFNCISSAILFGVLARAFDFQVDGVVMQTHAFIQLTLPGGASGEARVVEVETTSRTGYGWVHDAQFYKTAAKGWAGQRGLPPPTFEQYQARKIVPLHVLVAGNMVNQHMSGPGVTPWDRERLAEFSGALAAETPDRVHARLIVYSNEFVRLHDRKDHKTAGRLFARVSSVIEEAAAQHSGHPGVRMQVQWLLAERASTTAENGHDEEALAQLATALAATPPGSGEAAKIRGFAMGALDVVSRRATESKAFERSEGVFSRFSEACAEVSGWCLNNRFYNLLQWGNGLFKAKDYPAAIGRYEAARSVAATPENLAVVQPNIANAYLNMAIEHENDGNWPKAASVLQACVAHEPSAVVCAEELSKLSAQHQM